MIQAARCIPGSDVPVLIESAPTWGFGGKPVVLVPVVSALGNFGEVKGKVEIFAQKPHPDTNQTWSSEMEVDLPAPPPSEEAEPWQPERIIAWLPADGPQYGGAGMKYDILITTADNGEFKASDVRVIGLPASGYPTSPPIHQMLEDILPDDISEPVDA